MPLMPIRVPALAIAVCSMLAWASASMAFTPNPDTAVNRQDQVYSTSKDESKQDSPSTSKQNGDEVLRSSPSDTTSPQGYYYEPGPAMPYAYPDINLDGQEFFPEKADPEKRPHTYRPDRDRGYGSKSGKPQVYKPGSRAPNVYRPRTN